MKNRISIFAFLIFSMALAAIVAPSQTTNQAGQTGTTKEPALKLTCTADPDKVSKDGEAPVITVSANVEQKDESPLTYTWSVTGGAKIIGNDSVVTVDATDLRPGFYIVKVKVDDDKKNSALCRATFTVSAGAQPGKTGGDCPTLTLQADPLVIEPGASGTVNLTVVNNGTTNDKATYKWAADRGTISGDGDTVTLDASSLPPGPIRVTVTASIGKCSPNASAVITKKPSGL